jgi:hypothetical protein
MQGQSSVPILISITLSSQPLITVVKDTMNGENKLPERNICRLTRRRDALTLTETHCESEGLLSRIFRRPKLFLQVPVLPVSGAVNRNVLSPTRLDAVPCPKDLLGEPHGG